MKRSYWPAVLSALVVIALSAGYFGGVLLLIRTVTDSLVIQVAVAGLGLAGVVGVGWALVSRVLELRGGQEDDIGKY